MSLVDDLQLDIGTTTLSSGNLVGFLQKAARRVNRDLHLTTTTDEISINSAGVLSPTDSPDFEDLVLLAAECLIASRDFGNSLNTGSAGVRVKDGEQDVDTRQAASSREGFFNSKYSPCGMYEQALIREKLRRSGGRMVY